mmetsp:Transcript_39531/g.84369  ORF Transcript_39531/g.84369 Transcript_39531/m.84369 type:complete len:411 (+) Transcript_39531:329-1561(+)
MPRQRVIPQSEPREEEEAPTGVWGENMSLLVRSSELSSSKRSGMPSLLPLMWLRSPSSSLSSSMAWLELSPSSTLPSSSSRGGAVGKLLSLLRNIFSRNPLSPRWAILAGRFFVLKRCSPLPSLRPLLESDEPEELFFLISSLLPLLVPLLFTSSDSVLAKTCIQVSTNMPLDPADALAVGLGFRWPPRVDLSDRFPASPSPATVGSKSASKSRCSSSSSQEQLRARLSENSVFPARSETRFTDREGDFGLLVDVLGPLAPADPSLDERTTVPKLYPGATPIASRTSCDMDPCAITVRRISCDTSRSTSTCAAVWDWSTSKSSPSSASISSSLSSRPSSFLLAYLPLPRVVRSRFRLAALAALAASALLCLRILAFLSLSSRASAASMAASTCLTRLGSRKTSHSSAGLP